MREMIASLLNVCTGSGRKKRADEKSVKVCRYDKSLAASSIDYHRLKSDKRNLGSGKIKHNMTPYDVMSTSSTLTSSNCEIMETARINDKRNDEQKLLKSDARERMKTRRKRVLKLFTSLVRRRRTKIVSDAESALIDVNETKMVNNVGSVRISSSSSRYASCLLSHSRIHLRPLSSTAGASKRLKQHRQETVHPASSRLIVKDETLKQSPDPALYRDGLSVPPSFASPTSDSWPSFLETKACAEDWTQWRHAPGLSTSGRIEEKKQRLETECNVCARRELVARGRQHRDTTKQLLRECREKLLQLTNRNVEKRQRCQWEQLFNSYHQRPELELGQHRPQRPVCSVDNSSVKWECFEDGKRDPRSGMRTRGADTDDKPSTDVDRTKVELLDGKLIRLSVANDTMTSKACIDLESSLQIDLRDNDFLINKETADDQKVLANNHRFSQSKKTELKSSRSNGNSASGIGSSESRIDSKGSSGSGSYSSLIANHHNRSAHCCPSVCRSCYNYRNRPWWVNTECPRSRKTMFNGALYRGTDDRFNDEYLSKLVLINMVINNVHIPTPRPAGRRTKKCVQVVGSVHRKRCLRQDNKFVTDDSRPSDSALTGGVSEDKKLFARCATMDTNNDRVANDNSKFCAYAVKDNDLTVDSGACKDKKTVAIEDSSDFTSSVDDYNLISFYKTFGVIECSTKDDNRKDIIDKFYISTDRDKCRRVHSAVKLIDRNQSIIGRHTADTFLRTLTTV